VMTRVQAARRAEIVSRPSRGSGTVGRFAISCARGAVPCPETLQPVYNNAAPERGDRGGMVTIVTLTADFPAKRRSKSHHRRRAFVVDCLH
jgi:hypothetical protein